MQKAVGRHERQMNGLSSSRHASKRRNLPPQCEIIRLVNGKDVRRILHLADVDDVVRALKHKIDLDAVRIRLVALETPSVGLDVD